MTKILITGALGQIGTELIGPLINQYGEKNIIISDINKNPKDIETNQYIDLDVTDIAKFENIVKTNEITHIIHNAAILSATGENNPELALKVNNQGFENALSISKEYGCTILSPSSIAVFGETTPKINTPDDTIMRPNTMYGITKLWNELLGEYYFNKWGVDYRALRYPGIISYKTKPGGGTTDYAIDIFHKAILNQTFNCFISSETVLPMMYMPDCVNATLDFMKVPNEQLKRRVYNVSSFEISPSILTTEIKKYYPNFKINYDIDYRQNIAENWPNSLDDSNARKDWNWSPKYSIKLMTKDMIENLKQIYGV